MAWIFLSGGLLLPSLAPMDKADPELTLGYRELQVRGRLTNHLQYFIDTYMEPNGLDHSVVEETPFADYNCRFYTTREAFAAAMGLAMLDINYRKFKQTAEDKDADGKLLYPDGKVYHSVLNSIWSISTRLNQPGGWYGPRSASNPKGYDTSKRSIGSSFMSSQTGTSTARAWDDEPMWDDDSLDYMPDRESDALHLVHIMRDIPVEDWRDELDDYEYDLVKDHIPRVRREQKSEARRIKRARKRRRGKHVR